MPKKEKKMDDIIRLLNEIADHEFYGKRRRVPIVIATMFDLTSIATTLIKDGVDVNEPGLKDKTALFLAAARGHHHMCSILLEAGADQSFASYGLTPLDVAKRLNFPNIVHLLSNWKDRHTTERQDE